MSGNRTHLGSLSADVAQYDYTTNASTAVTMSNQAQMATVTSTAGTDVLVLPEARAGRVVYVDSGANGVALQTTDPTTVGINGGTGASATSAIPANTLVELFAITATNYIATGLDATGAVVAIPAAA